MWFIAPKNPIEPVLKISLIGFYDWTVKNHSYMAPLTD